MTVDLARARASATLKVYQCRQLEVVIVRIRLTGGTTQYPAPVAPDVGLALSDATAMLPTPSIRVLHDEEVEYAGDTRMVESVQELLDILREVAGRRDEGRDVLYCAVVDASAPLTTSQGSAGGFFETGDSPLLLVAQCRGTTLAHEIAHALGRPHSFEDPSFPDYYGDNIVMTSAGVTSASNGLGQWGVNAWASAGWGTLDGQLVCPVSGAAGPGDLMSYRLPQWPSPYTYSGLLQTLDRDPYKVWSPVHEWTYSFRADRHEERFVRLSGHVVAETGALHVDEAWEWRGWCHVSQRRPRLEPSELAARFDRHEWIVCVQHGERDELLVAHRLELRSLSRGLLPFEAALVLVEGAKKVSLFRGREKEWSTNVGEAPPAHRLAARVKGSDLVLEWPHTSATTSSWISFDGDTWTRIADGLAASPVALPLDRLPGSGRATVRLQLSREGALASTRVEGSIELPLRKGRLVFASTDGSEGHVVRADRLIELRALALDCANRSASCGAIVWSLSPADGTRDRESRPLGCGARISVALPSGRHRISVRDPQERFDGFDVLIRAEAAPELRPAAPVWTPPPELGRDETRSC